MDEKKLEVLPVAIRLFSEKGYHATSVEEIAKESGMAKGSFYKLFNSKEDLLLEILLLITKQIQTGLTKIYSKTYDSNHDKLVDFIMVCFENILLNHQLIMDIKFAHPLFKNKETEQKAQQMMLDFHKWVREFLLDIYDGQIKDYMGDFISLLTGLIFHYVQLYQCQKSDMDTKKIANFIAIIFDIMVKGTLERKPEPILDMEWAILGHVESPRLKGQKIQFLLKQMGYTIKALHLEEQEEYLKTLSLLEEECMKNSPKRFLVKALIHYLQSIPEIQDECVDLKYILEIE